MTEDDLEGRLRRMLDARAEQADPALSGPRLRHLADRRPTRARRVAPLLAAAAVVVIAGGTALLARGDDPAPRPVQPGGHTATVPAPPTLPAPRRRSSTPVTSPSARVPTTPAVSASSASSAVPSVPRVSGSVLPTPSRATSEPSTTAAPSGR